MPRPADYDPTAELSPGAIKVLVTLRKHTRLEMLQVAGKASVSKSTASKVLGDLVRLGLATRDSDPHRRDTWSASKLGRDVPLPDAKQPPPKAATAAPTYPYGEYDNDRALAAEGRAADLAAEVRRLEQARDAIAAVLKVGEGESILEGARYLRQRVEQTEAANAKLRAAIKASQVDVDTRETERQRVRELGAQVARLEAQVGQLRGAVEEADRLATQVRELEWAALAVEEALGVPSGTDLAAAAAATRAGGLAARAEVESLAATVAHLRRELEGAKDQAARLADAGAVMTAAAAQRSVEREELAQRLEDDRRLRAGWLALADSAAASLIFDACTTAELDLLAEIAEAYMAGDYPTAQDRSDRCRSVRVLYRVAQRRQTPMVVAS